MLLVISRCGLQPLLRGGFIWQQVSHLVERMKRGLCVVFSRSSNLGGASEISYFPECGLRTSDNRVCRRSASEFPTVALMLQLHQRGFLFCKEALLFL
jgi:hypothetical protein